MALALLKEITLKIPSNPLVLRVLSAIILIPLALAALYFGGIAWIAFLLIIAFAMSYEWGKLAKKNPVWLGIGLLWTILPVFSALYLRLLVEDGFFLLMWVLAVVWATDTAAFFVGRKLQGPKLAPHISPNKTWSGAIGGLLIATIVGGYLGHEWGGRWIIILTLALLFSILGQAGDLVESALKRHFGVKDTGQLIPGHGGALDRTDSLIFTLPLAAWLCLLAETSFLNW